MIAVDKNTNQSTGGAAVKLFLKTIKDTFINQFSIYLTHSIVLAISGILSTIMIILLNKLTSIIIETPIIYYGIPLILAIAVTLLFINYLDAKQKLKKYSDKYDNWLFIPHINAKYNFNKIACCIKCDHPLDFNRDPGANTISLFFYCIMCRAFFKSHDAHGNLIDAQESQKISSEHLKNLLN
jgi:hypothetical protein